MENLCINTFNTLQDSSGEYSGPYIHQIHYSWVMTLASISWASWSSHMFDRVGYIWVFHDSYINLYLAKL